jgi:hypothetical protein
VLADQIHRRTRDPVCIVTSIVQLEIATGLFTGDFFNELLDAYDDQ